MVGLMFAEGKARYIRSWISPQGKWINLSIFENLIMSVASDFQESVWYHICQSWSSKTAAWKLYVNGKLWAGGFKEKVTVSLCKKKIKHLMLIVHTIFLYF